MPAGADSNLTHVLDQAESAFRAQPGFRQSTAAQVQQASLTEQARLYRLSDAPQLQASLQSQPQPPVTNAWMERLLQELSLDDEEDGAVGYAAMAQVSNVAAKPTVPQQTVRRYMSADVSAALKRSPHKNVSCTATFFFWLLSQRLCKHHTRQ